MLCTFYDYKHDCTLSIKKFVLIVVTYCQIMLMIMLKELIVTHSKLYCDTFIIYLCRVEQIQEKEIPFNKEFIDW